MNTQELLEAIGGQAAIAREFEISDSAVSQWASDDQLPRAREMYLRLAHPGAHWERWSATRPAKGSSATAQQEA